MLVHAVQQGRNIDTLGTAKSTLEFVGHEGSALCVAVSHDGKWILSGSKDRTARIWDARAGAIQYTLQGHKTSGACVKTGIRRFIT